MHRILSQTIVRKVQGDHTYCIGFHGNTCVIIYTYKCLNVSSAEIIYVLKSVQEVIIKTSDSLTNRSETTKGDNFFEQTPKTCSGGQDRRSFPSTEFGRRCKSGCNISFLSRKLTSKNI